MSDSDECDPIRVAGDQGEIIDRNDDGAIECVGDEDGGLIINIDESTTFGRRVTQAAAIREETPAEFVEAAAREFVEEHGE